MPLTYIPNGAPGTKLGEARRTNELLEKISAQIEKQNDLLDKLIKTQTKTKK
ncbi:hypothetical protein IJG96_01210 [Candidatus Saccharibacteria bacterium]|nr:hypothetical protein [Candidatus Saccharibacteria bacterium]